MKELRLAVECPNGTWGTTKIYDLETGRVLPVAQDVSVQGGAGKYYTCTMTFVPAEVRITGLIEAARQNKRAAARPRSRARRLLKRLSGW